MPVGCHLMTKMGHISSKNSVSEDADNFLEKKTVRGKQCMYTLQKKRFEKQKALTKGMRATEPIDIF